MFSARLKLRQQIHNVQVNTLLIEVLDIQFFERRDGKIISEVTQTRFDF